MSKIITLIIVVIVLGLFGRWAISFFSASRVATGLSSDEAGNATLASCNGSMNCVSSTATTKNNKVEPFKVSTPVTDTIDVYAELITAMTGTAIVDRRSNYLHATFKTRLMGYTDDLELLLDENNALQVRSASRLGKSDLGANRKRVEHLRSLAGNAL